MSAAPPQIQPHRSGSFQGRITAVAMITAVAVLLAACAAFIAEQWRIDQQAHLTQQTEMAEMVSRSTAVRRAVGDPAQARALLEGLHAMQPKFDVVFLLDHKGAVLAGYGARSLEAARASGLIQVAAPIVDKGRRYGEIVTFGRSPSIMAILPRYLALTAALFFAATGLALFLGRWLAGRVTEPVNRLLDGMNTVADSGDLTGRVEATSDDELGRLTGGFNHLLDRLQENDQALRRTMTELVDARDTAESANRLKSQFLANMSHEIRTPLNGLLAMTQVMALEDMNAGQRQRLDVIRTSGEALLAILNDVLDVSKIEAGKMELEIDEFDTGELFRAARDAFAPVADRKGLTLAVDVAPEAAGRRLGDSVRLRQVLDNLVTNAMKFTEAGAVRVAVEGLGPGGEDGLDISVVDTGIGIAASALPQLFQKFTQADASTTRRFGGTGLGLAICQQLVELMGGRVTVESREGVGSTFRVVVPARRAAAAAPAPVPAAPAEPAGDDERAVRVLAAEDNATNQLVLTTVMGIFGVELTLVGDGRQAVEAWRTGDFDLILMDIQMPEMDGLAATRAIRAAEAETGRVRIPIIALSAHAMTHQVKEYLAAGIDLHVPKPIELPKLQAALAQAVAMGADSAAQSAAA